MAFPDYELLRGTESYKIFTIYASDSIVQNSATIALIRLTDIEVVQRVNDEYCEPCYWNGRGCTGVVKKGVWDSAHANIRLDYSFEGAPCEVSKRINDGNTEKPIEQVVYLASRK